MPNALFPSNYVSTADQAARSESSKSRYFNAKQLADGESTTVRLCGAPANGHSIFGYQYFTMEGRPRRFESFPVDYPSDIGLTWEGKNKGTGEKAKPGTFLAWVALRKEDPDQFICFDITQQKIREQIEATLNMEDYDIPDGGMANFYLTITRKGSGTDTTYTVIPTLKVATKADQKRWEEARDGVWLPALFKGGDPFAGRPSEAEELPTVPLTHRDDFGADHEISEAQGW